MYSTCENYILCGISTSFPVLFHTHRQVTHALLTRPPLIRGRSPVTVRLECVMHAASVHPEPGSNSLKNCISWAEAHKTFFRAKILSFSYFFEYYSMCFLTRFLTHLLFSQKFCFRNSVVQFSRIDAREDHLFATALLLYHTLFTLSTPFFNFFEVFLGFGKNDKTIAFFRQSAWT